MQNLSTENLRQLARLKQKKFRLEYGKVIVEGRRTLEQLATWGIFPLEVYLAPGEAVMQAEQIYTVSPQAIARLCDSENPAGIAGLFRLPAPRQIDFTQAFYLEEISDPGNLGTIFRTAAAFKIQCLILSPRCCEISAPKVIRASLGAVFKVPFFYLEPQELPRLNCEIYALDMAGDTEISAFSSPTKHLIALGSEAHGISDILSGLCRQKLRIRMPGEMESLNAALSFAIAAYAVSGKRG